MKLNLGSGNVRVDGFTNVDLYDDTADVKADLNSLPFDNDSVDEMDYRYRYEQNLSVRWTK